MLGASNRQFKCAIQSILLMAPPIENESLFAQENAKFHIKALEMTENPSDTKNVAEDEMNCIIKLIQSE